MTARHAPHGEVHATLKRLSQGTGPIVVGPWLTEVGYELLYWIPFVAWAQAAYGLDPARLVVVSRGGCQSWYEHLTLRYLDVLSWFTPEAFRAGNALRIRATPRQSLKHLTIGRFDREILAQVRMALGSDVDLLHPSLMHQMFLTLRPREKCQRYARHQPFLPVAPLAGLPDRYVAVRFYASSICPVSVETRALLADRLRALLNEGDVVLLHTGVRCDDHAEYCFDDVRGRLHQVADRMTPATNLEVQTRVIAGASRVVGTYGGYSYLAPLLGVDCETVYARRDALKKLDRHLTAARRVFASDPRFGALSVTALQAPHEAYACA